MGRCTQRQQPGMANAPGNGQNPGYQKKSLVSGVFGCCTRQESGIMGAKAGKLQGIYGDERTVEFICREYIDRKNVDAGKRMWKEDKYESF